MRNLKVLLIFKLSLIVLFISSCEIIIQDDTALIKKAIEEEILNNANDPESYSFVEMKMESITYNDVIEPTIESSTNKFKKEHYIEFQTANSEKLSEVAYFRVEFSHREKNRMGGLELFITLYDLKDENNNLKIIWSADKEDYESIRSQTIQGNIPFSLYENIAEGNGRLTALQTLEGMGLSW